MDGQIGWMYGWMRRWMRRLLLELLTQAGPQLLASAPLSQKKKKKKKRLLTSPEQREVERKSRQQSKWEWNRKWVGENEQKTGNGGGGLKGFGAYLIRDIWWKTEKDLTSSLLPTTISLKTKNPGRDHKVREERCWGMKLGSKKNSHLRLLMTSLQLRSSIHLYLARADKCVSSVPDYPSQCSLHSFSSFHSVHFLRFIDQTDPPWWHTTCSVAFPSHFISFSDHAVRLAGLTGSQTGWNDGEGGWDGEEDVGDISELITETEPAGVYVHVNLYSSPPTMSCCFLVPFTLSPL